MGLRLATRGSALALSQAREVAAMLDEAELVTVGADGERGDKSRFVRGVEQALLSGDAEIGVHSAKDLPAAMSERLVLAGVPARQDPADAWIGAGGSLADVPEGARVGTSSLRRRAQLLAQRPDLRPSAVRGNVDTRLGKLGAGELDALVLAAAGLRRLGREDEIAFRFTDEEMTPAPGQGALALQARREDSASRQAAASVSDERALSELLAERAVVAKLGAGCETPLGVRARLRPDGLLIEGFVGLPDGAEWIRDRLRAEGDDPAAAGEELAERLLAAGAAELLQRCEEALP